MELIKLQFQNDLKKAELITDRIELSKAIASLYPYTQILYGLTQRELARQVGMHESYISLVLDHKRYLSIKSSTKIIKYLKKLINKNV